MKRTVAFEVNGDTYEFLETAEDGQNVIFSVNKTNKEFDTKKYYEAFFAEDTKDGWEFEFETEQELKGEDKHIFDTIKSLTLKICEALNKQFPAQQADIELFTEAQEVEQYRIPDPTKEPTDTE